MLTLLTKLGNIFVIVGVNTTTKIPCPRMQPVQHTQSVS
jgi:hypothetical protein